MPEACGQPLPEWDLEKKDVERFVKELTKYMKQFSPPFQRVEQVKRSQAYVQGLLGNATRKNVEQMAPGLGKKVRSLQYFIGQSPWTGEAVTGYSPRLDRRNLGRSGWHRPDR